MRTVPEALRSKYSTKRWMCNGHAGAPYLSGQWSAPITPQTPQPGRAAEPASWAELRRLTADTETERGRSSRRMRRRKRGVTAGHSSIPWYSGRKGRWVKNERYAGLSRTLPLRVYRAAPSGPAAGMKRCVGCSGSFCC